MSRMLVNAIADDMKRGAMMADFIINSKPVSITLECPFCELDIELLWAEINPPKFWGDEWEDVKCPFCGEMISLGEWKYA